MLARCQHCDKRLYYCCCVFLIGSICMYSLCSDCDKGETDEVNTTTEWYQWFIKTGETCDELH